MTPDEQFVQAAIRRMYRWMAALAAGTTLVLLLWKGWRFGGGFALGASISILNFHWLKAAIEMFTAAFEPPAGGDNRPPDATAEPAAEAAAPSPAARAVRRKRVAVLFRFLLRYALIVGIAYVIFRSSVLSLTAFLGGLFVFVAGVLAEMIYELATGTGVTD